MIKVPLFKKQIEFIKAKERSVLMQGGVGSGKSYCGALWITIQAMTYDKRQMMVVARDFPQLKTATLIELKKAFDTFELIEDIDYVWNRSNNDIHFKNGTVIFCKGANNYLSAFRGGNIACIWADEADTYKSEAWTLLKGRLRVAPELLRVTSSPLGYNHIYEDFFTKKSDLKKVVISTTYDNPTLSKEYIEDLKHSYSPKMFQQEVMAERLNLTVGKVYSEFNREKHVQPCRDKLEDHDAIYFFTDYNVAHYCGVYLIHKKGKVYCIGEEHLEYKQTKDMALTVRSRFPGRHIIVCGDSTGNNKRDVAIERVNYAQFQDVGLDVMNFKNPPVHARIISANSNLYHDNVVIDPSCVTTIRDLELVSWIEGKSEVDKSNIDLTHASDAFTYGLWHFLAVNIKRQSKQYQG